MIRNRVQESSKYVRSTTPVIDIEGMGIVLDVILDETYEGLRKLDSTFDELFSNSVDTLEVGSALIRKLNQATKSKDELITYKPYDASTISMPIIGEQVELIKVGSARYYRRIYSNNLNLGKTVRNRDGKAFSVKESSSAGRDYREQTTTGNTNKTNITDGDVGFGNYFEPTNINRLKLYEGDTLIQSRFGQSIRFSAYNTSNNEFSPNIIIRNRQNDKSFNDFKVFDLIEEDINRDGSIIALTSNKYKLDFRPGTINENNKTDFKTRPEYFKLPEEYTDADQILLTSDRILLSSKSKELLMFSKGNYGFISDGVFYIENGQKGAELNFNGNVNFYTNRNDFKIDGNGGRILLNTDSEDEPLVRGEVLKTLMEELIDLIADMQFATPSGPTANGPINKIDFIKLKRKLRDFLSTKNFTE